MAKDPAMLWYWNDWQGGTVTLSRHLKGCYIDLLHAQFNNGHLSLDEVRTVLGPDFNAWDTLQKKFERDEKGLFFNKRLEQEQQKRKAFAESRRKNVSVRYESTHVKHTNLRMENENENAIENRNGVEIEPRFKDFWEAYGKKVDRIKCEAKWKKIPQGAREKIMAHVTEYVKSTPDPQYRKNPATYLNNESWNNEIIRNGNTAKQITRDDRNRYIDAKYGTTGTAKG